MKKLILSAAIFLGSLSTFTATAQVENPVQKETLPAEKETPATEEYTEIKIEDVSTAAIEALKKSFPEAKIVKALINEKKEYKLEVEIGDKVGSVYLDETGKWLKK